MQAAPQRMPQRTDRELVEAAQRGDTEAFGSFVGRHQKRVFRVAFHMLRDAAEAEDIAQEAFVRAYRAIQRFDNESEPFTWLYRITVNLSLNAIRARKVRRAGPTLDDPRIEGALVESRVTIGKPAELTADRQAAEILALGLDSLSETLRTTLILVTLDGLSHLEAAEVLGCPEGTIAWRIHEARKKLQHFLEKHGHTRDSNNTSGNSKP